jgi:FERM/RhoGEF/pleckstrin domain protein 2
MLSELELVCRTKKRFDLLYRDFEVQKICYLPFTLFLLKPIQRILHYKILFESKKKDKLLSLRV